MFSGLKDPARWSLPNALKEMGETRPDDIWVRTSNGESLTFGQASEDAARVASYLSGLGIERGDFVLVMMPNDMNFVRFWSGLGRLGAVAVFLNTELTGSFLGHQVNVSGARAAIVAAEYVGTLRAAITDASEIELMIVSGPAAVEDSQANAACRLVDGAGWTRSLPCNGPMPNAEEIAAVIFTSGTSGPSKGVLMTHRHCALFGIGMIDALNVTESDVYYITLPLFHANGLFMQLGTSLLAGISAYVRPRFSASAWINDVHEQRITLTNMLGTTAAFVISRPASDLDRKHRLRLMFNAPNLPEHEAVFRQRFGVADVLSGYGMTEIANPVVGHSGVSAPGAAGWVDKERYEVAIVDPETDVCVPFGEIGEIVVRPRIPFSMMVGYHNMPEKSVEAWRNLWFHTGDAGVMTRRGLVTFVDRIKDCIRRRGENISATEIERAVAGIQGVQEVAAYAVPSDIPGAEDEIMLAIVASPDTRIVPEELGCQADALLPRFAQPRFIQVMESLPKTATGKVQRAELRRSGSRSATDRQAMRVR